MKLNIIVSTALKKAFAAEKSIQKMAQQDFIMLNVVVIKHPSYVKKPSVIIQCANIEIT